MTSQSAPPKYGTPTREGIVATKAEWAAMDSINRHFTFRERTAFLCGWRAAQAAAAEECAKIAEAMRLHDDCGGDACHVAGQIAAAIRERAGRKE